jgi:hypothetical protein
MKKDFFLLCIVIFSCCLRQLSYAQCAVVLSLKSTKTWIFDEDEKIPIGLNIKLSIDSTTVRMEVEDPMKIDSINCTIKQTELCLWDDKNPFSTIIYKLEYREQKEDTFYLHAAKLVLERRSVYRIKFMRSDLPNQYMEAEMILTKPASSRRKKK